MYSLFSFSSGPIDDFVDENCLAYEKKYFEFVLIAFTASCSFLPELQSGISEEGFLS